MAGTNLNHQIDSIKISNALLKWIESETVAIEKAGVLKGTGIIVENQIKSADNCIPFGKKILFGEKITDPNWIRGEGIGEEEKKQPFFVRDLKKGSQMS